MMDTNTQTEFAAFTARGALIRTFETRKQALAWWEGEEGEPSGQDRFPGCRLDEVITTQTIVRRAIRRPSNLRLVRVA